jgi:hypothetical protein
MFPIRPFISQVVFLFHKTVTTRKFDVAGGAGFHSWPVYRISQVRLRLTAAATFLVIESHATQVTNSVAPEPEGSSPHSQQPANGPYPEPGESTPHTPNQSL